MNILLLQNYIIRINKTLFRDVSEKRNEKFYYTINSTVLVKIIQTLSFNFNFINEKWSK